jgi:NAD-dependent dihydropyrimidine dehydrogenase PreA subunit
VTDVIGNACVDVLDRACIEECSVDCIYGVRANYINPDECVDCGACEPVCPVEVIYQDDLLADQQQHLGDNAAFFSETLPGQETPLGLPGGAAKVGAVGRATPLVAGLPPRDA